MRALPILFLLLAAPLAAGDVFARSELLTTDAAAAPLSYVPGADPGVVFSIRVAPNRRIAKRWHLVTEFIPRADPAHPVIVESEAKPGARTLTVDSPPQPVWLMGDFAVRMKIYADGAHRVLLGHHEQYVPVRIDREQLEELGISLERPNSAPASAPSAPAPAPASSAPAPASAPASSAPAAAREPEPGQER